MNTCPTCGRGRAGAFRYCLGCGYDYEGSRVETPSPVETTSPVETRPAADETLRAEAIAEPAVDDVLSPEAPPVIAPAASPPPVSPPPVMPPVIPLVSEATDATDPVAALTPTAAPGTPVAAPPVAVVATAATARTTTTSSASSPAVAAAAASGSLKASRPSRRRTILLIAGATALLAAFALGLVVSSWLRSIDSAGIASPSTGQTLGLAASLDDVETVHSLPEFGDFTFADEPLADGRPREVGHSADGRDRMELVGPPADLTELSLRVPTPTATRELPRFVALWYPSALEFVMNQTSHPPGDTVRRMFGPVEVSVRVIDGGDATVTIAGRPVTTVEPSESTGP